MTGCDDGHCITCSDEAIPMRVRSQRDGLARCADDSGAVHEVQVDLIAPVGDGDLVLVHAGVAIARPAAPEMTA